MQPRSAGRHSGSARTKPTGLSVALVVSASAFSRTSFDHRIWRSLSGGLSGLAGRLPGLRRARVVAPPRRVLLDKPARRTHDIQANYVGFAIPDFFVIGYGLDFAERYRNLPFVGVLHPHIYKEAMQRAIQK